MRDLASGMTGYLIHEAIQRAGECICDTPDKDPHTYPDEPVEVVRGWCINENAVRGKGWASEA